MTDLAVGVDIGGTSSRALAVTAAGAVVGRGSAAGGNPTTHPPDVAASRVASAVADAVPDGASVAACLLGVAGQSKFTDPTVLVLFKAALREVGVMCRIDVVSDAEVAFASATSAADGTVLVGGTGSVAARIADHRKASWQGGWGWLLGDDGSGFWMGRQAVRATLRLLQGSGDAGSLALAVLAEAFGTTEASFADVAWRRLTVQRLITAVNTEAPIQLARYASLVSANASDPMAAAIIEEAAAHLAHLAHATRTPGETTPIVLAGSVISPDSPVGLSLREQLSHEAQVLSAADGAVGAAWLAALRAWGPDAPRPSVDLRVS
jgi:glucosamine kinase